MKLQCVMVCAGLLPPPPPPLFLPQVGYTMDLGQFGAAARENFYSALNKALQRRDPETMLLLNGCHASRWRNSALIVTNCDHDQKMPLKILQGKRHVTALSYRFAGTFTTSLGRCRPSPRSRRPSSSAA